MDRINVKGESLMRFTDLIMIKEKTRLKFMLYKLFSYLSLNKNIVECERQDGGGCLTDSYGEKINSNDSPSEAKKNYEFLKMIEKAKADWQFSAKLLSEMTDPDLIDYVIYLVKSNEAKYRYLLKLAREEKVKCELWQEQKINDI